MLAGGEMRLAATLRTDEAGRYRIRTVFPASHGGHAAHVHFELLEPSVGGFVNVRQEGRPAPTTERSFVAKLGSDCVWRLHVDLQPGKTMPASSGMGGFGRPRPRLDVDAWYPPRRDTTGGKRPR